ncbi:MAG: hypothetical protein WC859_04410 [Elusimicrobiota bacterium]
MVTLPGLSLVPGDVPNGGLTGSPDQHTAGVLWVASATITDTYYNPVGNAGTGNVFIQTSDPYDTDGATQTLTLGATTFAVRMYQQGSQTLTVFPSLPGTNYATSTVTGIPIVPGNINRSLIVLPGEIYRPGKPPYTPAGSGTGGKETPDSPSSWTAGESQPVSVYAVDAYWNQTSSAATIVLSAPSDSNASGIGTKQMVSGTTTYNVILYRAVDYNGFNQTLRSTVIGLTNPIYDSPAFTVYPDEEESSPRYLRILVNGETAASGTTALKTGTPIGPASDNHFVTGSTIAFTLDATDTWGNLISTNPTVTIVTDDPNAQPSATRQITLTDGTTTFDWNWVTKRSRDYDASLPAFTAATATAAGFNSGFEHLTVDPDVTKMNLQILVDGEFAAQGTGYWPLTTLGKTGAPHTFAGGESIPITVRVVDDYWNLIEAPSGGQALITIQANDPNVTNPLINGSPTTNGVMTNSVQLRTKNLSGWLLTSSGSISGVPLGVNISSPVPVSAGALSKLQIVVPGESHTDGAGKSGTPQPQVANTSFVLPIGSIRALDAFNNTVSTDGVVSLSLADIYGTITPTVNLSGGASASPVTVTLAVSTDAFSPQVIYASGFSLPISTSSAIPVNPGTPVRLQVLLPGENPAPGTTSGKSGSVTPTYAGVSNAVTVRMVDSRFNRVPQASQPTAQLTPQDIYAVVAPNPLTLGVNGQGFYNVTFKAANTTPGWTIGASTTAASAVSVSSDTSSVQVVNSTTTDHILLVLPGETPAPGSPRGFTGSPADATAGTAYISTVTITDRFYNPRPDTAQIQMTTTDPYAVPPGILSVSGPTAFTMDFRKAPGPWTISVSTIMGYVGTPLISTTSDSVLTHAATPSRLQILVPGQTADPGRPPYDSGQNGGYTGLPDGNAAPGIQPFTAGAPFDVTVNLVDAFFNPSEGQNTFVTLTTNDSNAAAGIMALGNIQTGLTPLPTGQAVFNNVALITRNPSGWQITASTATGDPFAVGISTWLPVQSGTANKLLVLAPGELSQEGNTSGGGKQKNTTDSNYPATPGTLDPFIAGTTYFVEVRAVDNYYNIVTTINPVVTLTSDDPNAVPLSSDSPKAMTAGVVALPFILTTAEVFPNTARTTYLTASAAGFTDGAPYQSGGLVMAPDATNGVQLLVPGQSGAPGTATGKTGAAISTQTAGTGFWVTVRAVDRFFNKTAGQPAGMTLTGTDSHDNRPAEYQSDPLSINLNSGTLISTWTFVTASMSGWALTANAPGLTIPTDTSPAIPVTAGTPRTLQIVLPGETAVPGLGTYNLNGTGRTGAPQAWVSGVSSTVVVNVVDKHFNPVASAITIQLQNNTDSFVAPQSPSFTGTGSASFTLVTATGSTSFTATRMSGVTLDASSSTVISSTFTVSTNNAVKLQILVPGETAVPGSSTGKSSVAISTQQAGVPVSLIVNAVDLNWNLVAANAQVQLATNDPYAAGLLPQTLSGGTTIFQMVFAKANQASGWTVIASTTSGSASALLPSTSAAIPVSAGPAAKLQVVLPGQNRVPGNVPSKGRVNSPDTAVAGQAYPVTVYLTDAYYNIQPNAALPSVRLVSSDPNDNEAYTGGNPQSLDLGTASATFGTVLVTAGTWEFTASTFTGANYQMDTDTGVVTIPGAPTKLIVLAPGQSLSSGTVGGVSGTADVRTAGTAFQVTVNATDAFSNLVSTGRNPVFVYTSDPYDINPGSVTLAAGQVIVEGVNFYTAGVTTLYAQDHDYTAPVLTDGSVALTVNGAVASQLQLVLPGETAVPGSLSAYTNGVSGGPSTQSAGAQFYVTANITDAFWNPVTTASATLRIETSDQNDASTGPWTSDGKDPVTVLITTGSFVFPMELITATNSGWILTATSTGPVYTNFTSAGVPVNANASSGFQRNLLALLPGESPAWGTATGKSGPVSPYTVGDLLNVVVQITDKFFNTITVPPATFGTNSANVKISIADNADPYAVIPTPIQAINHVTGQATFANMRLYRATTEQFVMIDSTTGHAPPWAPSISSVFTASPRAAANLLLLLPNETATPGSGSPGKTGSVANVVAGSTVGATVRVVDMYFNPVTAHNQERIALATTDPYAVISTTLTFLNGQSEGTFVVQMRTASTQTVTAVDTELQDSGTHWTQSVSPATGAFEVYAGPATRLLVRVPGETFVPGSATGRLGVPAEQVAGENFDVTVYQTDAQYNLVPNGTNPKVLLTSNDTGVTWVSPTNPGLLLPNEGYQVFTVQASSAQTVFQITVSTAPDSPAGTEGLLQNVSSPIRVYPGAKHHLHFFNLPATEIQAGQPFDGCLVMHDQFHNVLSTGPYTSTSTLTTISFEAQTTGNGGLTDPMQNPPWLPGTTTYNLVSSNGQLCLTNYFSLLAAGNDWLRAREGIDVTTERGWGSGGVVYSTRPYIAVSAGSPSQFVVSPAGNVNVPAGSLGALGYYPIWAKLADSYNNYSSSAGVTVHLSTYNVVGATGTISFNAAASSGTPPTPTWSVVTDSSGTIGISAPLYYYVSNKTGDSAQIRFNATAGVYTIVNETGRLTTAGGTTSKLAFVNPPASEAAGKTAQFLPSFILERRDDFDNQADVGSLAVALDDSANNQSNIHTARGFTKTTHDYEFQTLAGVPITGLTFLGGTSQLNFVYFDKMSSTPLEDGRLGTWTLQAYVGASYSGSTIRTQYNFTVTPDVTAKLGFRNAKRILQAGLPFDLTGNPNLSVLNLQLQDYNGNPTVTASSVTAVLTTTRNPSSNFDAYGFSVSSAILPPPPPAAPGFQSSTTSVLIDANTWGTTFYYMDTNASENYPTPGSRPLLSAWVNGIFWSTGTQAVTVAPNSIYRISLLSQPAALTAGTTSQAFKFATADIYGNPSPITIGDLGGPTAEFTLTSNSEGAVSFASPDSTTTFVAGAGNARIAVGESTMTFLMIDTLAGNHSVIIEKPASGWAASVSSYTVNPAPPDHIKFLTPSRTMVAGTTIQYEPDYQTGIPTNTVVSIVSVDPFGNTSPVVTDTVINFFADSAGARAWTSADNLALFRSIPGPAFSANVLPVPLSSGSAQVNIYYFDTVQGSHLMTAYDGNSVLANGTTTHVITAAPAAYLTVEPNFRESNPLPVNSLLPMGRIVARDQFGNIASGDPKNGQYYTGQVLFWETSLSTSVTLVDSGNLTQPVSSYTFKASDGGVYSHLLISDSIQETLHIKATDYVTPVPPLVPGNNAFDSSENIVRGWTSDTARNVPVHSLEDIVTAGIVVTPADLSPVPMSDPTYAAKQQLLSGTPYQGRTGLSQGNGTLYNDFYPVPLLRLTFSVLPPSYSSNTTVSQIRVAKNTIAGTLGDSDITEVGLIYDANNDGQLEPEPCFGCSPVIDQLVSTAAFAAGQAVFSGLNIPVTPGSPKNVFITVRISSQTLTPLPANLGLKITDPSQITINGLGVANNNFAIYTSTAPVVREKAKVHIEGTDIAAWWNPGGAGLGQQAYVSQGTDATGMLRLGFWTEAFQGTVNSLRVYQPSTANDADISDVKIYKDCNGDGFFMPSIDNCSISADGHFINQVATVTLASNLIVTPTTSYIFVAYHISPSAASLNLSARIRGTSDIGLGDGEMASFLEINSSVVPITPTPDELNVLRVNDSAGGFNVSAVATQGDRQVPVMKLTMQTRNPAGSGVVNSVVWTHLRLDRGNPEHLNRPSDIDAIHLYLDSNNNGNYEVGVDSEVTTSLKTFQFPGSPLAFDMDDSTDVAHVANASLYAPAPGRLVIGNEIMTYSGVDSMGNQLTGLTRATENSTATVHATGALVEGQAYLDLIDLQGLLPGQAIGAVAQNYFLAFDFNNLAYVSINASLGAEIRSTTYFVVEAPKTVGNFSGNIGMPATGGQTGGTYVGNMKEYGDFVVLTSTDVSSAITPMSLRQGMTNQAVMRFNLQANLARAALQSLTFSRLGTSRDSDVAAVKVWVDRNGTGIFNVAADSPPIGSGVFGAPAPGLARVTFDTNTYSADLNDLTTGPIKIETAARHLNTYFVSYDISPLAQPEKTIGVALSSPSYISVSAPNISSSTHLPASSILRTIIPSPQTMRVDKEYCFTNDAGTYPMPRLIAPVQSPDDAFTLDTTTGLPITGILVLDSEIFQYAGITLNVLTGITRCLNNSCNPLAPPTHSTYTVVNSSEMPNFLGFNYTQGSRNVALMKLTLRGENNYDIRWYSLDLGRNVPGGLNGTDSDISAVNIYTGDTFVRDSGGDVGINNILMGTGVSQYGSVHIPLDDPTIGAPGYVVISTNPRTFWVAADISQSAPSNNAFFLNALSKDAFIIGALSAGDGVHTINTTTFPMQTGTQVVAATIDTMTVTFTDVLPTMVQQNKRNAKVAKINVKASNNTAVWQALTVERIGQNTDDSDIVHVNLWKDLNDNGAFDDGNPTPTSALAADLNASATSMRVSVSSSFPSGAGVPGVLLVDSELIRYTDNDGVDTFTGLTRGFLGTTPAGHLQNRIVYGVTNDTVIGDNLVKPGLITNGTNNFSTGVATLTFVTPQVVPNVNDRFTGVNYFLAYDINPFSPLYRDINNNGVQEPNEQVTMGARIMGASSFNVVMPKLVALANSPPLTTKEATLSEYPDQVTFIPDDTVAPNGATQGDLNVPILKFTLQTDVSYAYLSSLKVSRNGQGNLQTLGSNDDIALIKVYRDANFNEVIDGSDILVGTGSYTTPDPTGTQPKTTTVNFLRTETLTPTPQTYFIAYDIALGATSNNAEGVGIQDPGWFNGSFIPAGVDAMLPDNLPHDSRKIIITPLTVRVTGRSLTPESALQGTTQVPLLAVTVTPSINQVIVGSVTVTQTGTIQTSTGPFGATPGDGDFSQIYVYLDANLNGELDISDTLMGSLPWGPGLGHFQGGVATIPLSVPVTFNTSGGTLLLAADIGTLDGSGTSTQGHLAGLSIAGAGGLAIDPSTALQDPLNSYPIQSADVPIYNFQTVQISTISVRPDITLSSNSALTGLYLQDAWSNRQDQVSATWLTNPPMPLPSNVSVSYQVGVSVSSDITRTPSLTNWITINSQPPVNITGLGLSNNGVYFLMVRTITTINGLTLPPSPINVATVRIDITKPSAPKGFVNLPTSTPSGVITLQWPPAETIGPSGLFSYKIRQYVDGNPVPLEIIQTSTPNFTFGAENRASSLGAQSAGAPGTVRVGAQPLVSPLMLLHGETGAARPQGHFYRYQIQTINGAGSESAWSEISGTIDTGLPEEIITKVSNYPNPVDTRKGGIEGRTFITYLLASDANVDITVYDLLGYRVMHWNFQGGTPGGLQGPNTVPPGGWDGTNEAGQKVSKGGYLAQIQVSGGKGSSTVIRKIGVIH